MREMRQLLRSVSPDVLQLNPDLVRRAPAPAKQLDQDMDDPAPFLGAHEEAEQRRLFDMVALYQERRPELRLLFHVPNGGWRSKATAGRLKDAGVRPGVPDLCLPVPRGFYHGLWLELKVRRRGARLTPEQRRWLDDLRRQGYWAEVCYGADAALTALLQYLRMGEA
jgi:hypothetical protein